MTESFFEEKGLYYRTNQFDKTKKTLVFVHGLSGSSSAWREYETYFEKKYNILTFDLRGHGKSIKPSSYQDYKIERYADDLNALIDVLNINSCILIGHSIGAAVILEYILAHPNKVSAVVFLAPDFHTKGIKLSHYIFPIISWITSITRLFPIFKHEGGYQIDYDKYRNTGDWNIRRIAADISNTGLHVYFYSLKQLYKFNRKNYLKKVNVPVLIIHGSKDTIVPIENSINMKEKIFNSSLLVLPNANHILVLNNFKTISQAISDFIVHNLK